MNIAIEMNKLNIVVLKNGGKISTNEEWYFKNIILKVVSYNITNILEFVLIINLTE